MTGVQRGGATGYDLSIRGFKTTQTDKNAILVDGLPGITGRYGSPPTVATETDCCGERGGGSPQPMPMLP